MIPNMLCSCTILPCSFQIADEFPETYFELNNYLMSVAQRSKHEWHTVHWLCNSIVYIHTQFIRIMSATWNQWLQGKIGLSFSSHYHLIITTLCYPIGALKCYCVCVCVCVCVLKAKKLKLELKIIYILMAFFFFFAMTELLRAI